MPQGRNSEKQKISWKDWHRETWYRWAWTYKVGSQTDHLWVRIILFATGLQEENVLNVHDRFPILPWANSART